MMGCFAVVRMNPVGLMLVSRAILRWRWRCSLAAPDRRAAQAGFAMRCLAWLAAGDLRFWSARWGRPRCAASRCRARPLMWIVIGLYIAFRLTLIQQSVPAGGAWPRAKPSSRLDPIDADRRSRTSGGEPGWTPGQGGRAFGAARGAALCLALTSQPHARAGWLLGQSHAGRGLRTAPVMRAVSEGDASAVFDALRAVDPVVVLHRGEEPSEDARRHPGKLPGRAAGGGPGATLCGGRQQRP